MTKDDTIRMALEANLEEAVPGLFYASVDGLERFAALVAAAEREQCAKVCLSLFDTDDDSCNEAEACATAIRARGNQ